MAKFLEALNGQSDRQIFTYLESSNDTFMVSIDEFSLCTSNFEPERIPSKEEFYQSSIRNINCSNFYSTHDGIEFFKKSSAVKYQNDTVSVCGTLEYDDNYLMRAVSSPVIPWLEQNDVNPSLWVMNVLSLKESEGKYYYDYDSPDDFIAYRQLQYKHNQFVYKDYESIKDIEIDVKVCSAFMESFCSTSKTVMPELFLPGMDGFVQWYFRNDMEECDF